MTLTALASTEPFEGAQSLQWFLSEAWWNPDAVNECRLKLLLEDPSTAPTGSGVLDIDETGDRKDGSKKTAHVGKQYFGGIDKIDNGVVSVSSLWADERIYYPLEVEPYTPAHHFEGAKADPAFRIKPKIALELVEVALETELPFRAVVVDIFYGEHRGFREMLERKEVPYVMALGSSHTWWHRVGETVVVEEVARASLFGGPEEPGESIRLERTFRDGRTEEWWALEAERGPYGPEKRKRLMGVTTDPDGLPERTTWYVSTNIPVPGSGRAEESKKIAPVGVAEVVRLYGLRMWVEQSYKRVKQSLGWAQYQVRSDLAIRCHWQLVCFAFSLCWRARAELLEMESLPAGVVQKEEADVPEAPEASGREKGGSQRNLQSCCRGRRR